MKTVLVVDDEENMVLAMDYALSRTGYRVLKASSGEDALLIATESQPDLVLLDLMMPGMGGLETLKMLKSHSEFRTIPVIIMSGVKPLVRQSDYKWAAFLTKPFSIQELLDVVAERI